VTKGREVGLAQASASERPADQANHQLLEHQPIASPADAHDLAFRQRVEDELREQHLSVEQPRVASRDCHQLLTRKNDPLHTSTERLFTSLH
jgi:hypothetical protein